MRFLGGVVVGLAVMVLVVLTVGFLLPREVVVSRTIVIAAPPEAVFEQVNSLQRGAEWSPWMDIDPEVQAEFSGPEEGVGSRLVWASDDPQVGSGSQEIIVSEPPRHVRSALDFGPMGTAETWFDLVPEGEGTSVTWGLQSDMGGSPLARWMGLMMRRWVGADYERGLVNLKGLLEGS